MKIIFGDKVERFKLVSSYQPKGDQPQAIKELVSGVQAGEKYQTLLGVTGSGKTFSIANVFISSLHSICE